MCFLIVLQRGWELGPDKSFNFRKLEKKTEEEIPSQQLALQAIEYARELEMIV